MDNEDEEVLDSASHRRPSDVNESKRKFLIAATSAAGRVIGAAVAVPFLVSVEPSARARAAGASIDVDKSTIKPGEMATIDWGSIEVDISTIKPGEMLTVEWHGKPVWILNRTKPMLESLTTNASRLADPKSGNALMQPANCANEGRSIKPEYLVVIPMCTHEGCKVNPVLTASKAGDPKSSWPGGFLCPCHFSRFDLAGRVFAGDPAEANLEIPPYYFLNDTRLLIGEEKKGA